MKLLTKVHVKFRDTPDKNYVGVVVAELGVIPFEQLGVERNLSVYY